MAQGEFDCAIGAGPIKARRACLAKTLAAMPYLTVAERRTLTKMAERPNALPPEISQYCVLHWGSNRTDIITHEGPVTLGRYVGYYMYGLWVCNVNAIVGGEAVTIIGGAPPHQLALCTAHANICGPYSPALTSQGAIPSIALGNHSVIVAGNVFHAHPIDVIA